MKKLSIFDCQEIAHKMDGKCLSVEYINSKSKMLWKCANIEHPPWEAKFDHIKNGHWCPHCAGNAPSTLEKCQKLAKNKNGRCLTSKYTNNKTLMLWECKSGHQWTANWNRIKCGRWCPYCYHDDLRDTLQECREFAKSKGGRCLSNKYTNNQTIMLWKCATIEHPPWKARFNSIKGANTWCPYCAGNIPLTLKYCQELARNKGGKCLSEEYINNNTNMLWECKNKHQWPAKLRTISGGCWCPECNVAKTQDMLCNTIRKIFNCKVMQNFKGFSWLKNIRAQEIDIWVPDLKLAIEYDGKQHFEPIDFFGGTEDFNRRQELDRNKDKLIMQHSEDIKYFIRFSYKDKITDDFVKKALKKIGANND